MKEFFKKVKKFFSDDSNKIKKVDIIIMAIFVVGYSILSFWNLGTIKNPQTFLTFENVGNEVTLESETEVELSKIRHYSGDEVGSYEILVSQDNKTYETLGNMKDEYSFKWTDTFLVGEMKYIKIISTKEKTSIGEIKLYDKYGQEVKLKTESERGNLLIDEEETVPKVISYMNSTYFDEIYFARSAYQYVNGIPAMEWVHPPLGKLIQMIPILLFGMTTFAYRLMGNIAGILMIPLIYIFAKKMFKSRKYALLAAVLMTFDNFHFAQTRMGTVDSFLVLFMILSSYFMYLYLSSDKKTELNKKLVYLGLCGLFFGLATTVKWTGLYLGLGLAILFFGKMILDFKKTTKKENKKELRQEYITIVIACLAFFVIIPAIIYGASYFLFPKVYPGEVSTISQLIEQIKGMFNYHANLNEPHPFSSEWYTWPIMLKPVWYYVAYPTEGFRATICGIGNPAIWWVGAASLIYVIINMLRKRKLEFIFLSILALSLWLPYAFIGRVMFLYHYFPVVPFMMLAIVALIKMLEEKLKTKWIYFGYIAIVILLFLFFYPVVSGKAMPNTYLDSLQWFDTWYW